MQPIRDLGNGKYLLRVETPADDDGIKHTKNRTVEAKDWNDAAELFQSISGFEDAYQRAEECRIKTKELKLQEEAARKQLERSVSDIAHDLRTPLTVIKGNLQLLELIADRGGTGIIVDKHNRITLHRENFAIDRDSQWGKYLSFFAWGGKVKGLSLKGFHYGLDHYKLGTSGSLGVSNELDAKTGIVEFTEGQLLMVESAD